MNDTLPRTIKSLAAAGFDEPRLFIDGWYGEPQFMGLPVTTRDTPIRLVGNWMAGMWELYTREPKANRFAMFQDDVIAVGNLRSYLEQVPYPEDGYLNLYTFLENTKRDHKQGWGQSHQRGMGALGLVFDRDALQSLMQAGHMARKPLEANNPRSWKALDGGIVDSLKHFKIREYIHLPSLLQHIGTETSTLGNSPGGKPYQGVKSFPGESQNALEYLLPEQSIPVERSEDPVAKAIELIGANSEMIRLWINKDCPGCMRHERKRKLGAWASRVLLGKVDGAEDYLRKILED
jgi:hypothetical protein